MQRLPGHTRTPYGYERVVLRRLPVWLLGGTVVPALSAGMARLWPWDLPAAELAARIGLIDILAVAVVILSALGWVTLEQLKAARSYVIVAAFIGRRGARRARQPPRRQRLCPPSAGVGEPDLCGPARQRP